MRHVPMDTPLTLRLGESLHSVCDVSVAFSRAVVIHCRECVVTVLVIRWAEIVNSVWMVTIVPRRSLYCLVIAVWTATGIVVVECAHVSDRWTLVHEYSLLHTCKHALA